MIWHWIWFVLGAICGGTAVALLVLYTAVAIGAPGPRPGRPPRHP
jgi:hypothetical protein